MEKTYRNGKNYFEVGGHEIPVTDILTINSDIYDTKTSATVVYEGWQLGTSYLICKIDLTAETRTYEVGLWANRVSLFS